MDIKIIGAGFAGLAAAYYLAKAGTSVTVISSPGDPGASQMAAGLVHRFGGAHAKPNWRGEEAMRASEELFAVAQKASSNSIILQRGALRLALSDEQVRDFQYNASHVQENEWRENHDLEGVVQAPGLWIPHSYAIHSAHYLEGLKRACQALGVIFEYEHLTTLPSTPTLLAAGASSLSFFPMKGFGVTKGQLLRLTWPESLPPLPYALNSKAYIVMDPDQKSCWVGSTYERQFTDAKPNPKVAYDDIMPKAVGMIPALADSKVLDCQAGLRVSTPSHQPRIVQLSPTCWGLVGFGSKGLLYHALLGQEITNCLLD